MLLSQNADNAFDHECDPDTKSVEGISDVEDEECPEALALESLILAERIQARAKAFASLDSVNLVDTFHHRPPLMQTPWVLRGAFRAAIQEVLQKILERSVSNDEVKATRGWKLLLLLPRMILFRPGRGGSVPRSNLEARITSSQRVLWLELFAEGSSCVERVHTQSVRGRRRQQHDDEGKRAARALSLVQLSAAKQALEGAPVAPGKMASSGKGPANRAVRA